MLGIEQVFDHAAEAFGAIFRQSESVDTLEWVIGRMVERAGEFLDMLAAPPAEKEGELLVLTANGKSVPMVHVDAVRLRSGNRRLATLASMYSVDRHVRMSEEIVAALFRDELEPANEPERCPEPQHKRVIARFPQVIKDVGDEQPGLGMMLAICWASCEVQQRRRQNQGLIRLMGGQPSLWQPTDAYHDAPGKSVVDIRDIVHVSHYVWRAAKVFHSHRKHQEAFARERLLRILQGEIKGVLTCLRRRATPTDCGDSREKKSIPSAVTSRPASSG
jgi:hypothetical protein